jgi:3'-phosphoadenosine 5'-phosphosulfate sulfotransferase (PAPS reductase)/FAD synthetase
MADESKIRRAAWLKNGCNAFNATHPASSPMAFWTEQDILEYIQTYNVPYCSVYGDIVPTDRGLATTGCSRTGCIFCMFGVQTEKDKNRFQRLKETHPRQYEYCINGGEMVDGKWQPSKEGLGLGKVLDYIGVRYD